MQTTLKTDTVGNKLRGKRVVLASASARRKEILEDCLGWTGFEVVPSTFEETLSHQDYVGRELEYPVETAAQKYADNPYRSQAIEVYEKEVTRDPENPPDIVISADTIVLLPSQSPAYPSRILEKPGNKAANLDMLEEQNDRTVKVITGVNIVYPSIQRPGYAVKSMAETTSVVFAHCPPSLLAAYVEHGEGVDRAGGWAIQGLGSSLIRRIEGDFNNVKGFPAHAFYAFMQELIDNEDFPGDF